MWLSHHQGRRTTRQEGGVASLSLDTKAQDQVAPQQGGQVSPWDNAKGGSTLVVLEIRKLPWENNDVSMM